MLFAFNHNTFAYSILRALRLARRVGGETYTCPNPHTITDYRLPINE
jgi:hypothetical protein